MPQISVIVPVYNVEKYIHRCVDSILAQTFTDFELILVDDGSPDNCGAICDEYAAKDSRVRVIHQENGGLSAARNAGIDLAFANSDSQWLTFIDSDDWVHLQYLESLYIGIKQTNLQICVCAFEKTDGGQVIIDERKMLPEIWGVEDFYVAHTTTATIACAKLYAKDCFSQIRYPIGKLHEDEFITYRILFDQDKIAFIPAPLYAYFVNPEGIMKAKWTPRRLDAFRALDEQIDFFRQHGYELAFKTCISTQIQVRCNHILQIRHADLGTKGRKSLHMLQRTLAKYLLQYHVMFPFNKENRWIYDLAFPKSMKVYWVACALGAKICRMWRKQ